MRMRYDANMPSATYDQADYDALRRSNIPVTLSENPALRFDSAEDAAVFFARELDAACAEQGIEVEEGDTIPTLQKKLIEKLQEG